MVAKVNVGPGSPGGKETLERGTVMRIVVERGD